MLQKTPTDRTKQNTVLEKLIVGQLASKFPVFYQPTERRG